MKRILILGPPGSGKSTLARRLATRHGLPVFHLDQAYWRPGWIEADPAVFRAEVERIAALPAWVIDGNYTLAPRLARADTAIYLDAPSWLCLVRVLRRSLLRHGRVRADLAPGCPERFDLGFLRFVWNWSRSRRARSLATIAAFAGRRVVLRGRASAALDLDAH